MKNNNKNKTQTAAIDPMDFIMFVYGIAPADRAEAEAAFSKVPDQGTLDYILYLMGDGEGVGGR